VYYFIIFSQQKLFCDDVLVLDDVFLGKVKNIFRWFEVCLKAMRWSKK
jgi:hypothetical protein